MINSTIITVIINTIIRPFSRKYSSYSNYSNNNNNYELNKNNEKLLRPIITITTVRREPIYIKTKNNGTQIIMSDKKHIKMVIPTTIIT